MDNSIRLPTGHRIGLDGLIGLIPGIGDLIGAAVSSYFFVEAARLRVPGTVLARMAANVVVETVVGAIPVFGDIFDLAYKANARNYRLLEGYLDSPVRTRRSSAAIVGLGTLAVMAVAAVVFVIVIWLMRAIWQALFG